jgi:hypothetical protein
VLALSVDGSRAVFKKKKNRCSFDDCTHIVQPIASYFTDCCFGILFPIN